MGRVPAFALLVLLSQSSVLRAQSTNGSISGRVTDATGAVLVDVSIVAVRTDTNARHQATTNASGNYNLTNLMPGLYRIELEKSGFNQDRCDPVRPGCPGARLRASSWFLI